MTNTLQKIMHNGDEYVFPGDVKGPASSTDGHLALFDGATGKLIKDGGAVPTVPTNISSFTNDSGYLTSSTGVTSINGSHGAVTVAEFTPGGTATTGDVVTKTDSGYEWSAPSGGDVLVSDQANNIFTPGMKIWGGTEGDFNNLTPDSNTAYLLLAGGPTPPPPLPAEYQEVEWIGSSGSQRIDTGVVASANIGYEINVNFTALSGDWAIMTTDNSWDYRYGVSGYYDDLQIGNNKSGEMHVQILDAVSTGVDYVFLYNYNNSGECKLNGNVIVNTIQQSTMPYTLNMNIFTENHSGSYVRYCSCKLYYMKMWNGTTLVRDFIPCYRKLDSVIGLYDTVNDVFYTNDGSGTFTKGNDVN